MHRLVIMPKHKGGKHDTRMKNKHNAHQIAKTAAQPRKTILNKIRKLGARVRMSPNDRVALEALRRAQARK